MEKKSEIDLGILLEKYEKNSDSIYYSPRHNDNLKKIFSNCSKTGNGIGIPDRIIFNDKCMIIIECKKQDINKAVIDITKYHKKIKYDLLKNIDIYFIAFINKNNYKIFDNELIENTELLLEDLLDKYLDLNKCSYNIKKMEKKISYIHNYIRDNTKISNEDKPFFIAIILISLSKKSFRVLIDEYNNKKYIYDILIENIREYDIDASIFEFMRNDKNNIHFLHIIKSVKEIFDDKIDYDLLNIFYSEFVKYDNSDSKSLGIVLTPDYITDIMTYLLKITRNDIILDICTGTGTFLLKSLVYKPKQIIGCEYQNKLFTLLKCNMIIRNIKNYSIYKEDCFNLEFKATKSIINPPYGMKDKTELDFVNKQLDSVEENGLVICILPISCLKKNTKIRQLISSKSQILTIIKCNEKIFYPSAGVKTCIILLEKNENGHDTSKKTKIIDNSDDGFEMKRGQGRIKKQNYQEYYDKLLENIENDKFMYNLCLDGDWTSSENDNDNIIDVLKLKRTLLEIEYHSKLLELENTKEIEEIEETSFKKYKIGDLFDVIKKPKKEYKCRKIINNVAAKNNNNGVKEQILSDSSTFTGNKIVLVMSGDGGAGLAYYQESDFKISSTTCVLDPKNILLDKYIGVYCAVELSKYKKVYSRGYSWTLDKIKNDYINIPVKNGNIDYEYIRSLF